MAPPTGVAVAHKITQADVAAGSVHFDDPDSVRIELIPYKSIYVLERKFDEKSFATTSPIPKGTYRMRIVLPKTGESKDFLEEVQ